MKKAVTKLVFVFLTLTICIQLQAQLVCNDMIYVSTSPWDCEATLNADMMLEGGPYDYSVMTVEPSLLTMDDLNKEIVVTVTNTVNNNSCWGTVRLEDKIAPVAVSTENITVNISSTNANCSVLVFAEDVDNGSYDGCGEVIFSPTSWEFSIEDEGINEVEFTVCDESGNCNSTFVNVLVTGNCITSPVVHEIVNIALEGNQVVEILPELLLKGEYDDYTVFSVTPSSVSSADLGQVNFTVSHTNGQTASGILNVCEEKAAIAACAKVIQTIEGSTLTGIATIDQTLTEIAYSCYETGYELSFSASNSVSEDIIVNCEDVVTGIQDYTIYLWTGNILVDECTNMLQVLDGAGYCDGVSVNCTLGDVQDPAESINVEDEMINANNIGTLITPERLINVYGLSATDVSPSFSSDCDNLLLTYEDQVLPVTQSYFKVIRKFTILDWIEAATSEFTQLIRVNQEFVTTMACNDHINVSATPWGCQAEITPDMVLEGGPYDYDNIVVEPNLITELNTSISYTATNTSTGNSCFGTITMEDKTPPVAIISANVVVSLSQNPQTGTYAAKVFSDQVDNGSHDGDCGPVSLSPEFWEFDCGDVGSQTIIMTVWDDANGDGTAGTAGDNYSEVWTIVEVELKIPVDLTCPDDVLVNCSTDLSDAGITGTAETIDGCNFALDYRDQFGADYNGDGDINDEFEYDGLIFSESNRPCANNYVQRTWTIGDSECRQNIFIENTSNFDPNTIVWPEDEVTDCSELIQEPTWEEDACGLIGWSVNSDTFLFEGQFCKKVINEFTVVNWCTYDPSDPDAPGVYTSTSVVNVEDAIAPTLERPSDLTLDCHVSELTLAASASDECEGSKIFWVVRVDLQNDFQADFEWSSYLPEDGPNNLWDDDDANGVPDLRIGNKNGLDNLDNNYTTNNQNLAITLPEEAYANFEGTHRIVWTATDECGNQTSETTFITVDSDGLGDIDAPTPYCINLSTAVMDIPLGGTEASVEVWAIDFDFGSFDNCTSSEDLRFTFSDVNPDQDGAYNQNARSSSKIFTSSDITNSNDGLVSLPIYVFDNADNYDFCLVNLRLIDNTNSPEYGIVNLDVADVIGNTGDIVCVPIKTRNFDLVSACSGTIEWDPSIIELTNLGISNLPQLSLSANFNTLRADEGLASFLWTDNTGMTPVTLTNNTTVFELCFEVIGDLGEVSKVSLTNEITPLTVSSPSIPNDPLSPTKDRNVTFNNGSVTVKEVCSITEDQINPPAEVIEIFSNEISATDANEELSPENLILEYGYTNDDVTVTTVDNPNTPLDIACEYYALSFEDELFVINNDEFKILRRFYVIDWLNGTTYEFNQIIKVIKDYSFICDFLPNTADFGDCDSGHTMDDDVEWPADINIADHRISPDELEAFSNVPTKDSRPEFVNTPDLYTAIFEDVLVDLTPTSITIDRTWSVNRQGSTGFVWTYTQQILIDISDFDGLVSINTLSNRPLPNVEVSENTFTALSGTAYISQNDVLNLQLTDDVANGLNIKDHVMIIRRILGLEKFSHYDELAADFNGDNRIDGKDLIDIRNSILGSENDIEWRFFEQQLMSGINLEGSYVAIKPGDIDDSANIGVADKTYAQQALSFEDVLVNKGEFYDVNFKVPENFNTWGFQLAFDFNEQALELVDIESNSFAENIIEFTLENNVLKVIMLSDATSVNAIDEENVFTLRVKGLENTVLARELSISDTKDSYTLKSDFELYEIKGEVDNQLGTGTHEFGEALISVFPNPVSDYININLPVNADQFQFSLISSHGQLIKKTFNETRINVSDLTEGSYLYQLTIEDKVFSDKILIVK